MTKKQTSMYMLSAVLCALAPAAWAANPGDVIITEIMYNTAGPEGGPYPSLGEWIELYNTTDSPIDLTGWHFADEDGRSGDFEPFVLPARGIVVLINVGNGTNTLTKEQFSEAWGIPVSQLIQPTAVNDFSGPRPDNVAQGGMTGSGLSNSPTTDGNDANDLVNTPYDVAPCAYRQNFCVTPAPDSEVELLVDNTGQIIDKVHYLTGSGWPNSVNGKSIVLNETLLNATDNDSGSSWYVSNAGEKRAKASTARASAPFNWVDIGSPGEIEGITTGNQAPSAVAQTVWVVKGGSYQFGLTGVDDNQPEPPTLNYIVDSLPANGALYDVDNGNVQITSVPYAIPNQKRYLRYVNDGTCSNTSFTFHVNDTELNSASVAVTILVQCGDVIITEVMYNPASSESGTKVTEYVEVYNTTASPIDVSGWYLTDKDGRSGDWPAGTVIPAGGVAVIIPAGTATTVMTPALFRVAWDGYTVSQIIQPLTGAGSNDDANGEITRGGLGNTPGGNGEQLRIVDASGRVQDVASYTDTYSWPVSNGESSIFLLEGNYDAASNDLGVNWANSRNCAGGAYGCAIGGFYDRVDFGSPGYLAGVTTPAPTDNVPPTPLWQRVGVLKETPKLITLGYCDDGRPTGGAATFTITTLPANGSLTDAGNSAVIVTVPYTLVNNGNQVIYTPNAGYTSRFGSGVDPTRANDDVFYFKVNDGAEDSRADGQIRLIVQKGGLIITEIMYNPANQADNDWEWIEVLNTSGSDITLDSVINDSGNPSGKGYVGAVIPAGAIRIIAPGDNLSRTAAQFVAEWAPLDPSVVLYVDSVSGWEFLGNSGGRVQLIDASFDLLDDVIYDANAPWPVPDGKASIYALYGKADVLDNDLGENWALSADGTDNAYATPETTGDPTDSDVGSPALLPKPPCNTPPQDADGDGDVDLTDFGQFQGCFNGPNRPFGAESATCLCFDGDKDADVDLADFGAFQSCFNGPNRPAACP